MLPFSIGKHGTVTDSNGVQIVSATPINEAVPVDDITIDTQETERALFMSQSLVKNLVHLVYSTKNRNPWIPADVRKDLYAYQAGTFSAWESPAIVIGGVDDHVHALFSLSKNYALKKVVEEVKKASSKWMKTERTLNEEFYWQGGYAGFSVSPSKVDEMRQYLENQEEHHRKMTFQEELRLFFKRHGIEFDERYVWD